jgi:hypothetical protein
MRPLHRFQFRCQRRWVPTQVRMPVQVKAADIACLHEQKSADIQQES